MLKLDLEDLNNLRWSLNTISSISQDDYNYMLAGGAVRDLLLNRDIKDYDFWVGKDSKNIPNLLSAGGLYCRSTYEKNLSNSVLFVMKYGNIDVVVVDIEVGAGCVLKNFDMSLCQVGISMSGVIYASKDFLFTVKTRKNFYTEPSKHVQRIKDKFPTFTHYQGELSEDIIEIGDINLDTGIIDIYDSELLSTLQQFHRECEI